MDIKDIDIRRVYQASDSYTGTELQLIFEGKNIDEIVMNTLRQLIYKEIPIYAVSISSVDIETNNTYYDHYEMQRRLASIPIPKIKSDVLYLDPMYYPYVKSVIGSVKPDHEYPRDPKDTTDINFYVSAHNESSTIMNVTTNDVKVVVDGKEMKNLFDAKHPDLIIRLKKGHKFVCSYKSVLGIAKLKDYWSAVSNISAGITKNGNYFLKLRSYGQLTEWECLTRACDILIIKINKIVKNILDKLKLIDDDSKELRLIISNESHLIGNILSHVLRKHPKVTFCGYAVDHPAEPSVSIEIKTTDKYSPTDSLKDAVKYITKLFTEIKNKLIQAEKVKFTMNKVLEKVMSEPVRDDETNELMVELRKHIQSTQPKSDTESSDDEE